MKKLLLLFFVLVFTTPGFADVKNDKNGKNGKNHKVIWTVAELSYYSGPVSPEYQYRWTLTINNDRNAMFTRTGAGRDTSYSFTVSRKCFNKLNKYIKKYKLTTANPSEMETTSQRIGGHVYTLKLTVMNTNPDLDQPPQIITFPSQQNDKWTPRMDNVINSMECAVPDLK